VNLAWPPSLAHGAGSVGGARLRAAPAAEGAVRPRRL